MYPKRPGAPFFIAQMARTIHHLLSTHSLHGCDDFVYFLSTIPGSVNSAFPWIRNGSLNLNCSIPCKSSRPLKRIEPWNCWSNKSPLKKRRSCRKNLLNEWPTWTSRAIRVPPSPNHPSTPHFPLAEPVPRADGTALGGPLGTPSDGAALGPMEGVRETAGDWPKAFKMAWWTRGQYTYHRIHWDDWLYIYLHTLAYIYMQFFGW